MKNNICLCGSDSVFVANLRGFNFYDCGICELRFVEPRHQTEDIYDESYFNGAAHGFGFSNYEEDKKASDSYLNLLLDKIEKFKDPDSSRLLDVGAANGYFISLAAARNFDSSGIEVSKSAVEWANSLGRNVKHFSIEMYSDSTKYDVVTILDVLEHLDNPKSSLMKIRSFLQVGGLIAINVPDRSSLFSKLCGMRWHAYLPPEHWYYFNRKSLGVMLNECGFEVVSQGNLSKTFKLSYILQTVINSPQFPLWTRRLSSLTNQKLGRVAHLIQIPLPLYDNLYVIAKAKKI